MIDRVSRTRYTFCVINRKWKQKRLSGRKQLSGLDSTYVEIEKSYVIALKLNDVKLDLPPYCQSNVGTSLHHHSRHQNRMSDMWAPRHLRRVGTTDMWAPKQNEYWDMWAPQKSGHGHYRTCGHQNRMSTGICGHLRRVGTGHYRDMWAPKQSGHQTMQDFRVNMNNKRIEFSKKLDGIPVSDYHGLENQGATCYLNSVLQVLFMTRDFREDMKSRVGHSGQDSATIDRHLGRLFSDLERATANTCNITKHLGITKVHEQRDSAEYLEKILSLTSPDVSEIFKGHLRHRTTCFHCLKQTDVDGLFWTLPLSMENSHTQHYSVSDGFKAFFMASELDMDNKMYCEKCETKTRAAIESQLTKHPEILILLLKRFEFDCGQMCYVKLHCCVDVPQTLQTENGRYDFYASVDHFGSIKGGHYTATVKSYETGEWYCFNDTYVRKIKPPFGPCDSAVRSNNAYLLFYRKVASTDSQVRFEANLELRKPGQKCEESSWWDNDLEMKTQTEASADRKMNKQQNPFGFDVPPGDISPHLFQERCDVAYWQEIDRFQLTDENHLDNVKKAVKQTMSRMDNDVKRAMTVFPAEGGNNKEINNTREHQKVYTPSRRTSPSGTSVLSLSSTQTHSHVTETIPSGSSPPVSFKKSNDFVRIVRRNKSSTSQGGKKKPAWK